MKYGFTNPQKSIWLTEQFYEGTAINSICGTVFIKEKVDFNRLQKAINIFVQKNDSMRIKIVLEQGEPKQFISEYEVFDIRKVKVSSLGDLEKLENEVVSNPFKVLDNDLFKFTMFCFPDGSGRIHCEFTPSDW